MSDKEDQAKTEEATPHKLRKAREKGQIARGSDLGFFASMVALGSASFFYGEILVYYLARFMRDSLSQGLAGAGDTFRIIATLGDITSITIEKLLAIGALTLMIAIFLEILQTRGIALSAHPLVPDFNRLNPAKGLGRLFSARILKETLKSVIKLVGYSLVAWWSINWAIDAHGPDLTNAFEVTNALRSVGGRILIAFIGLSLIFAAVDQIIVRAEFRKKMRMSRSELLRENREREGEPRLKQKRRDIQAKLREQAEGFGRLAGSDLIIVNPEHFAVALRYNPSEANAPVVQARGRNYFAQILKKRSRHLGIAVIAEPELARALYFSTSAGEVIGPEHYHDVARIYLHLRSQSSQ